MMKKCSIVIAALIVTVGALVWANVSLKRGPEPDLVLPMVNARIEWSGAGYSGIYGK